ncbi:MAG TPA: hypothetical protein VMZ30_07985 [Pyrinomonadaceae bacterium]|nr:hypothetical protein [Pyrinomonadaceae bacterium]
MAASPNPRDYSEAIPFLAVDEQLKPKGPVRGRIDSIDLLRGIVMVIMMFDHTRDFVHSGGVPLFFYILQWYTAHLIAVIAGLLAGQSVAFQFASPIEKFAGPPPAGVGFRLWVVYVCWLIGVALLYPLCKWFAGVKARRRYWWLSYL